MTKQWKRLLLLCCAAMLVVQLNAQVQTVTGTVKDADGNPIAGATVAEKGGKNQVMTNANGTYSIKVKNGAVLVISSVGFGELEQKVTSNTISVNLSSSSQDLDGVVVTALGIKRQKKSLGYSVQEVKGATLSAAKETNLANALIGKVAGLHVVRASDGVGGSSKIILRGYNSLTGSNQPLIVVDGVPMDNFTGRGDNGYWNTTQNDNGNGLADINPEDIESLSILKGGAAAALYGSRAANGVIMITTKNGKSQKGIGVTFNASVGFNNIFTHPEMQNTFGQGDAGAYSKTSSSSWGPVAAGQQVEQWNGKNGPMNIYDNVRNFMQTGTNQSYGLSIQQQYKQTSFYASFNRLEDRGLVINNKLVRNNFMVKTSTKFGSSDKFTLETKLQYNNTQGYNRPIAGRDNSSAFILYMLPRSLNILDFKDAKNAEGNMYWYPGQGSQENPYWSAKYNLNQDVRDRFLIMTAIKYDITKWLNAELKYGTDMYTNSSESKKYAGGTSAPKGRFAMGKSTFYENNLSLMFTAKKDNLWGKWNGSATLGGNLMETKNSSLSSSAGELVVPNLFTINNADGNPTIGQGFSQKAINSLYGSAQLNYDNYFYIDATFRNDWSSTLSKANRSFIYPSLSTSLIVTDMLQKNKVEVPSWLTYAKVRASTAYIGNGLEPYQLYNTYWIGKDPNGNTTAGRGDVLFDENVVSESLRNIEVGAETRFLKGRFGIDFTWYKNNALNQLINLPMDAQSGYSSKKVNAGNIENSGIELSLDARALVNPKGLNWTVGFNFSQNRNKIIELAEGRTDYGLGGYDDLNVRAVVGGNYGEIWGSRFNRVKDVNSPYYNQVILNSEGLPTKDGTPVKIGDQQAFGLFGLTNTFTYKGLSLSFLIDARLGGQMFSATQIAMQKAGTAAATVVNGKRDDLVVPGVVVDGTGYKANTTSVSASKYWTAVTDGNLGINEFNIYDATNMRIRNVQVSYDIPSKVVNKLLLQRAKVGMSMNNVSMLKSYMRGVDPESAYATGSNAVGFESGGLPTMRTFLINLSIGF